MLAAVTGICFCGTKLTIAYMDACVNALAMADDLEVNRTLWNVLLGASLVFAGFARIVRAPLLVAVGAIGVAVMGLHYWYYAAVYVQFYETVDWSERWGSESDLPIPASLQPWVNGAVLLGIAVVLVGVSAQP